MFRWVCIATLVGLCFLRCGDTQPQGEFITEVPSGEARLTKEPLSDEVLDASADRELSTPPERTPGTEESHQTEKTAQENPRRGDSFSDEALRELPPEAVTELVREPTTVPERSVEQRAESSPETGPLETKPEKVKPCTRDPKYKQPCQVGLGVCQGKGEYVCHTDGVRLVCNASADPSKKKKETCDGLDNDCDGMTDESTCDDGNACNGVEVCDSKTKMCLPGKNKVCTDKNPCNGTEVCNSSSGMCQSAKRPTCPVAPPDGFCKTPVGTGAKPVSGKLMSIPNSARFQMRDANQWTVNSGIIQKLAAHSSIKKVSLQSVLGDLNRVGKKVTKVTYVPCFQSGFQWNSGDSSVRYWYPQGLTGSATAFPKGTYLNKKLLVASWYHKPKEDSSTNKNKGARLSLTDITNSNNIKYRLLLLVEPYMNGTRPDFRPVVLHAGGIAWFKNLLYVADTSYGLRVFDMNQIMQVATGEKDSIGYSSTKKVYYGFNYKYVVPQVSAYKLCWSCCARFSFVAVDLSSKPAALVTGEYTATQYTARLHRWPLHATTGRLVETNGVVKAVNVVFPSVRRIQGALTIGGRYWISSSQPKTSNPKSPGSLYTATVGGRISTYTFPYPPEDLHYDSFTQLLWSHTENPNKRYVFGFPPKKVLTQCK